MNTQQFAWTSFHNPSSPYAGWLPGGDGKAGDGLSLDDSHACPLSLFVRQAGSCLPGCQLPVLELLSLTQVAAKHRLVQDVDGCCSEAESLNDGGDVENLTHERALFDHRRNDDRVSRKDRLMIEA